MWNSSRDWVSTKGLSLRSSSVALRKLYRSGFGRQYSQEHSGEDPCSLKWVLTRCGVWRCRQAIRARYETNGSQVCALDRGFLDVRKKREKPFSFHSESIWQNLWVKTHNDLFIYTDNTKLHYKSLSLLIKRILSLCLRNNDNRSKFIINDILLCIKW